VTQRRGVNPMTDLKTDLNTEELLDEDLDTEVIEFQSTEDTDPVD